MKKGKAAPTIKTAGTMKGSGKKLPPTPAKPPVLEPKKAPKGK